MAVHMDLCFAIAWFIESMAFFQYPSNSTGEVIKSGWRDDSFCFSWLKRSFGRAGRFLNPKTVHLLINSCPK